MHRSAVMFATPTCLSVTAGASVFHFKQWLWCLLVTILISLLPQFTLYPLRPPLSDETCSSIWHETIQIILDFLGLPFQMEHPLVKKFGGHYIQSRGQSIFRYSFLATLGLRGCAWAFSSCGNQGCPGAKVSPCGGLSCCRARAVGHVGFSSWGTWA